MAVQYTDAIERYISLSHIVDDPDGGTDKLRLFSIPTGQLTEIEPTGEIERLVYYGIMRSLQGPPKTKEEVLDSLGLEDELDVKFAEMAFDALEGMSFIAAAAGMARVHGRTFQNLHPYQARGYSAPEQVLADRRPYAVKPGAVSVPFEVQPTYERATTREFDATATLDLATLEQILVDSYRTSPNAKRPVPSPGGIYPVRIHVVNHSERVVGADGSTLEPGVYQYDPLNLALEQHAAFGSAGRDVVEFLTCDINATDAPVWLLLGIDMRAFEQKYGNASQMFLGICIGAAMQRIVEEAEKAGLGSFPYFGIQHHFGDQIVGHDSDMRTVLAIGLGKPLADGTEAAASRKVRIAEQLEAVQVGTEELFSGNGRLHLGDHELTGVPIDFVGAWVRYGQLLTDHSVVEASSFGTATTYEEALLKATAEALERVASGNVRVDVEMTPASELDGRYIDPRQAAPFDARQRNIMQIKEFTSEIPVNWTAGVAAASGETVYAPSSLVYYPYTGADAMSRIASSGVAAHFDRDEAMQRGFLELIERDAIMRTWVEQTKPSYVDPADIPREVAYRLGELTKTGRQVDVLNITQENGIPVFMVTIRSETFPHFYAGASSNPDAARAINKAFDEAVAGFTTRILLEESVRADEAERLAAGRFNPDSHAMLYAEDPAMAESLHWLYEGERSVAPAEMDIPTLDSVIEHYNPVVFELDNTANGNQLHIVRVVAPDLVPITFGRHSVPYLHPAFPAGTVPPAQPHFFG